MMKRCFKCRLELPLGDFYAHPSMGDGHLNKCKACARADVKSNYVKRRAYYRDFDRKRDRLPARRAARAEYAQTAAGKVAHARANQNERANYPERSRARTTVARALRSGRLVRSPCRICGIPEVQAHHSDYQKPLEVDWLCVEHHGAVHGKVH